MKRTNLVISLICAAGPLVADPLSEMEGTWRGSGWARETPQGPQETVRCQIQNVFDDATGTLTTTGQCVVPGRRLEINGTLIAPNGADRITGRWSNPGGIGSARVVGRQSDGIVAYNFSAIDPATGRDASQNVEWRVSDQALRLRSSDRKDPNILMSDITFKP